MTSLERIVHLMTYLLFQLVEQTNQRCGSTGFMLPTKANLT